MTELGELFCAENHLQSPPPVDLFGFTVKVYFLVYTVGDTDM